MAQTEVRTIRVRSKTTTGGGGGGLPAWMPAPGEVKSISLNNIADVRQSPYPITYPNYLSGDPPNKWDQSGTVFSRFTGNMGSLIQTAMGGHGSDQATDGFVFDIETRLWRRIMNTYPDPGTRRIVNGQTVTWYTDVEGVSFSREHCEYLVNGEFGKWYGYTPSTFHTRGLQVVRKGGTNNQGILTHPFTHTIAGSGGPQSTWIHDLDLGVDNPTFDPNIVHWTRGPKWPAGLTGPGNGIFSFYDESLNAVGVITTQTAGYMTGAHFWKYDCNTGTASLWAESDPWGVVYLTTDSGGCYIEHRKLLLLFNTINGYMQISAIDVAGVYPKAGRTNQFFKAIRDLNVVNRPQPTAGADYPSHGFHMDYSPTHKACFGMYASPWLPSHKVLKLQSTLDITDPAVTNTQLMNDTWTFTDVTPALTGDAIQSDIPVGTNSAFNHFPYNSFRHMPAAPGNFIWHLGYNKPVQMFNLNGL